MLFCGSSPIWFQEVPADLVTFVSTQLFLYHILLLSFCFPWTQWYYTITMYIYFHSRYFLLKLRKLFKSLWRFHGRMDSAGCGSVCSSHIISCLWFPWGRVTKHRHHLHISHTLRTWHPESQLRGMQHPKGCSGGPQKGSWLFSVLLGCRTGAAWGRLQQICVLEELAWEQSGHTREQIKETPMEGQCLLFVPITWFFHKHSFHKTPQTLR